MNYDHAEKRAKVRRDANLWVLGLQRPPTRKTGHTTKRYLQKEKQFFIAQTDMVQTSLLHDPAASCPSLLKSGWGELEGSTKGSMPSTQQGDLDPLKAGTGVCSSGPSGQSSTQPGERGGDEGRLSCTGHSDLPLARRNHLPLHCLPDVDSNFATTASQGSCRKKEQTLEWGALAVLPPKAARTLAELGENWTAPLRMATGQEVWCCITHHRAGRW